MTDPIEQRLLWLAEAAAEEWPVSGGIPAGETDDETGTCDVGDRTAALIAALSAPTVSRLARVVAEARKLPHKETCRVWGPPYGGGPYEERCNCYAGPIRDSVRALDADTTEGGHE